VRSSNNVSISNTDITPAWIGGRDAGEFLCVVHHMASGTAVDEHFCDSIVVAMHESRGHESRRDPIAEEGKFRRHEGGVDTREGETWLRLEVLVEKGTCHGTDGGGGG
jgi:hypothetical protein